MEVSYWIDGPDQIDEGVRPGSNLARQFIDEWQRVDPVRGRCSNGGGSGLMTRHHGRSPEIGGSAAKVRHLLWGFFLQLRNNVENLFYWPWAVEASYTERATAMLFAPIRPTVGNSFGASLVWPQPRTTSSRRPLASPATNLLGWQWILIPQRILGFQDFGWSSTKSELTGAPFIGVPIPNCRRQRS
jgi:hypothetical protein